MSGNHLPFLAKFYLGTLNSLCLDLNFQINRFCLNFNAKNGRMSGMPRLTILPLVFLFLIACTAYPVAVAVPVLGIIGEGSEIYEGQTVGLTSGSISLTGIVTGIRCHGNYKYTFLSPNGVGSTGLAAIQCQDGRLATIQFTTESSEEGWGFTEDNKGDPFIFTFGKTDSETVEIYKQVMLRKKL